MSEETTTPETTEESTEEVQASAEETSEVTEEELNELEKAEEIQMLRKLQLKIDGKEVEEELPFDVSPEHAEWMTKQLQLAKVSQKRMQEAAEIKKNNEALESELKDFLLALKEDPRAILTDPRLGIDLKKLATEEMNRQIEEEAKSPEQKEKERLEKEREELALKVKEMEEAKARAEQEKLENELAREYENGVIESIQENGLQQDPRVIKRYADAMKAGLKFGIQLTPQEIGPIIKKQLFEEAKFYVNQLGDEELDDFIGKDRMSRVRKSMISRLRKKMPPKNTVDTGNKELEQAKADPFKKKSQKINSKDFFKQLKSKGF